MCRHYIRVRACCHRNPVLPNAFNLSAAVGEGGDAAPVCAHAQRFVDWSGSNATSLWWDSW